MPNAHKGSLQNKNELAKLGKFSLPKLGTMWSWELSRMKWPTPLGKKLGTIGYFKKQILGVKGMEMDSGVSHLTIVHVSV